MILLKIIGIIYLCTLVPSFLIARAMEKREWIQFDYLRAFLRIWITSPIAIPHCLYKAFRR